MQRLLVVTSALTAVLAACGEHTAPTEVGGTAAVVGISPSQNANPKRPGTTVIVYDSFQKAGAYTLADQDSHRHP